MSSKKIYIYSPSGAVRDKKSFKLGTSRLKELGYQVQVDPDALTSYQRFAGDDHTRLKAIIRAASSNANIALISRGGYGLTRLLPFIPFKNIAKSINKGTKFVGISDFTAFQSALLSKTGAISWAGPGLCEGFGLSGVIDLKTGKNAVHQDEIMEACFDDLIIGQGEGAGWRVSKDVPEKSLQINDAILWGGNLTVLTSLIGTPYFPLIKGGILFLEDVAEPPYRIERMLSQLVHSGVIKNQKAVLWGQFTGYSLTSHDRGFNEKSAINYLRQSSKTPILTNLPYGHVPTKILLPVGAKVNLTLNDRNALLYWGSL